MQTILGSGGTIGNELAGNLLQYTDKVRLVSRNPVGVNETDEVFKADLMDQAKVTEALEGSDVAYLVAGLKYDIKVWRIRWPVIMANVIHACKKNNTRLVFFDNVYMYGKVDGPMTEHTPVNPCSGKGEVRARIAQMLMDEVDAGNLQAMIVRAADFYGPNVLNSVPYNMIILNYMKGRKAQLFCADHYLHSYTYTPDAGKATALLGNSESAFNQVWHLPTHKNPMIGKEWIEAFAGVFNVDPDFMILRKWMVRTFELSEMLYQYDRNYIFDSSKFEKEFHLHPTPYLEGISETVRAARIVGTI